MIIQVLNDVFADGRNDDLLDNLWKTIEGPHSLYLKNDSEIDAIINSSWFLGLRNTKQKAISEMILKTIQSSSSTKPRIKISQIGEECFSIEEAIKYLDQPFSLIIENRLNDAPFFDSLFKHFPKQAKKIEEHKEERWFKYEMGGGSTIMHGLRAEMRSFYNPIFKRHASEYLRCFVLIDSDRNYPDEELKSDTKKLIQFLERCKVPYHILEKREMENYLPEDVFSEIADNREFIDAYLRLSPLQKDYFDIEKGFEDKSLDSFKEEVQQMYKSVQSKDFVVFRKQSLDSINGKKNNFKSEFPRLFLSSRVTRDKLLARCAHHSEDVDKHPYNPNELPDLLTEISSLL